METNSILVVTKLRDLWKSEKSWVKFSAASTILAHLACEKTSDEKNHSSSSVSNVSPTATVVDLVAGQDDLLQTDLKELLEILCLPSSAQPHSPHFVFQSALFALRARLRETRQSVIAEALVVAVKSRQRAEARADAAIAIVGASRKVIGAYDDARITAFDQEAIAAVQELRTALREVKP